MEFAPEMLEYANLISSKGLTGFTQGSIQERRDGYSAIGELLGEGPLMKEVQDVSIPSENGNVFIKNYIPKTEPKSKILYFHGGGWVVGRLKDFDPFARKLAEITSSIGIIGWLPSFRFLCHWKILMQPWNGSLLKGRMYGKIFPW